MKFSRYIILVQCFCLTAKTVWSQPDKKALCEKKCKDCGKGKKCVCNKEGASNTAFCLNESDEEEDESNSGSTSEDGDATSNQEQEQVIFVGRRPGPCDTNPCQHGGTCVVHGKKYKCRCASGYNPKRNCQPCEEGRFGRNCRYECHYCNKHFGCHHVTGCKKCIFGFKNSKKRVNNCKLIDCKQNPCLNGGRCRTTVVSGCVCPVDSTGKLCETKLNTSSLQPCRNEENIKQCKNGGSCYTRGYTFEFVGVGDVRRNPELEIPSCLCPKPYAGSFCEKGCTSGSQNCPHGSCKRPSGSGKGKKVCVCHTGWKGDHTDPYCEVPCDPGKWGLACSEACGRCVETPCDRFDGMCLPGGCLDNFQGDNCDISPNETENYFAAQADLAPGDKKAKFAGRLRLRGKFPKSPVYQKLLKNETETFVKSSSRRTFRQRLQQTTGRIRAIVKLRPGSVIVDFSLFVPRELVSGRTNIERDMVKGFRNDAKNFRSSVGNYSVDRSSIIVTSVSSSGADTSDHFPVILLAICSIIGLLALSLAMIVRKVHSHPKMAISGGSRAISTN